MRVIRIAARQSDLARLQAYLVGEKLERAWPDVKVEYAFRASLGDLNQNDPLWKMPEKGVFTEDFLRDLREGTADMVVHSWKDLPIEERQDTEIAATLPRADVRDLLLFRDDRLEGARVSGKVKILTSSPRRAYNLDPFLRAHLPFPVNELVFEPVRGNIPTRLKKLLAQEVDGLIVAKAALDRLLEADKPEFREVQQVIRETLARTRFMVLPLSANPTAAAQGALAVEIRRDREDLRERLKAIHCEDTYRRVARERRILADFGGGCHQKIGVSVLKREYGEICFLRGLTDHGEALNRIELSAPRAQPRAESADAIFPKSSEEERSFYEREELPREEWAWIEKEKYLWVARENAWPRDLNAESDAVVWTAGLRTWAKLAERGIWVNGSSESLGAEEEPTGIETLVGVKSIPWVKLSHADADHYHGESHRFRSGITYRLRPRESMRIQLRGRTHFYWTSASAFARALELEPGIRTGHHACGPGATARYIRKVLGPQASLAIYLNADDWRKAVLPSEKQS